MGILRTRMKPSWKTNQNWLDLADATEKIFASRVDGFLSRVARAIGLRTADDADAKALLLDNGFDDDRVALSNIDQIVTYPAIEGSFEIDDGKSVFFYDVSNDSDGGRWVTRFSDQSWVTEAVPGGVFKGGPYADDAAAVTGAGAFAVGDWYHQVDAIFIEATAIDGSGNITASKQIYRAGSASFPKQSAFIASDNEIIVFDATGNELEMWMVFSGGNNGQYPKSDSPFTYIQKIYVVSGQLIIGVNGEGLQVVDFVRDSLKRYYTTVDGCSGRENISTRNDETPYETSHATLIQSHYVYDMAVTVRYGTTPDPLTGLVEPVIVMANGDVEVIVEDKSVYPITGSQMAVTKVAFSQANQIITMGYQAFQVAFFDIPHSGIGMSAVDRIYYPISDMASNPGEPHILSQNETIQGLSDNAFITISGLTIIDEDGATPEKGMVAHITHNYNTGWMQGDCQLAALNYARTDEADNMITIDRSGHVHDLILTGSLTAQSLVGGEMNGVSGFSAGNHLSTSSASEYDISSAGAFVIWMQHVAVSEENTLCGNGVDAAGVDSGIRVMVNAAGFMTIKAYDSVGIEITLNGGLYSADDAMHCWLVAYDGTDLVFYFDGAEVIRQAIVLAAHTRDFLIGASQTDTPGFDHFCDAPLTLCRVFKTAPSEYQIRAIYNDELAMLLGGATLAGPGTYIFDVEYNEFSQETYVMADSVLSTFDRINRISSSLETGAVVTPGINEWALFQSTSVDVGNEEIIFNYDGSGGTANLATVTVAGMDEDKVYYVSYTAEVTSGAFRFTFPGKNTYFISQSGEYSDLVTAITDNNQLSFGGQNVAGGGFVGKVSNFKIVEISPISPFTGMGLFFGLTMLIGKSGSTFDIPERQVRENIPAEGSLGTVAAVNMQNIRYKDTQVMISRIIGTEFRLNFIEWQGLWAPKDTATYSYGSVLLTSDEVENHPTFVTDDLFLTSRGVLQVNHLESLAFGLNESEFEDLIRPRIQKLLPVKNVYNGLYYRYETIIDLSGLIFDWIEGFAENDALWVHLSELIIEMDERYCLDEIPLDSVPLDSFRSGPTPQTQLFDHLAADRMNLDQKV